MAVLNLSLYRHASGVAFSPEKVIEQVKVWFPHAVFKPGDQLAISAERAERFFAQELLTNPDAPCRSVVESLRRKSQAYGPALAFEVPCENGKVIRGLARSVNMQFLFDEDISELCYQRLVEFLRSLGVGRLESSFQSQGTFTVLDDLHGPSTCLRDEPGVPWLKSATRELAAIPEI